MAKFEDLKVGQRIRLINWTKVKDDQTGYSRSMNDVYEGRIQRLRHSLIVFEYGEVGQGVFVADDTRYEILEDVLAPGYYTYRHPVRMVNAVVHVNEAGMYAHVEGTTHISGNEYFGVKPSDIVFVRITQR